MVAENPLETTITERQNAASRRQWWVVVALIFLSLILGMIGFLQGTAEGGHPEGVVDALYDSMRLFHMHFEHPPYPLPWELQVARFLAPLVLLVSVFKGFVFVARSHRRAFTHRTKAGHVVICGLGRRGLNLARQYQRAGDWVVVVDKRADNALLGLCDEEGIHYVIGDATEISVLQMARIRAAKLVIVVTPEDDTNLRIAIQIRHLALAAPSPRVECYVHLENVDLRERLQRLFDPTQSKDCGCRMTFFDVYDSEARRVLLALPLDGQGIGKDDPRTVHVVIIGFGRLGCSIALRAAKMGHFANGKKLRLSVIDRHADRHRQHVFFHYPMLQGNDICLLEFHQAEAQSLWARRLIEEWAAEDNILMHVFVCIDDNATAVEVGLRLQEVLADRSDINLCVRVRFRDELSEALATTERSGPPITPMGILEETCCDFAIRHEPNEDLARAFHEDYIAKRRAESLEGDPALQSWRNLRDDFRESNRQQADHMAIKIRAIGCELVKDTVSGNAVTEFFQSDIDLLAPVEHQRWTAERRLAGWKYGKELDKGRRISPYLVGWSQLTEEIRDNDRDGVRLIPSLVGKMVPPMKVVRPLRQSRSHGSTRNQTSLGESEPSPTVPPSAYGLEGPEGAQPGPVQ